MVGVPERLVASLVVVCALSWGARANATELLVNGGFEAGLDAWTVVDLAGGEGSFFSQTGPFTPVSGEVAPLPPEGNFAAMSDALGPGSHVLYQDFFVPDNAGPTSLSFQVFLGNRAGVFFTPAPPTLRFDVPMLNQQARVDIMRVTADPFSVDDDDILLNVFQTTPATPVLDTYQPLAVDLTSLILASRGQRLRLRFAETDNVFMFQLGVDDVSIEMEPVPEPASLVMLLTGLGAAAARLRRPSRRE